MPQQYDNNLRGVLFANDKRQNDRHPNLKGNCEIEGIEYWLSAWTKRNPDGSFKLLSLAFEPKEQQAPQSGEAIGDDDLDDDIPF